MSDYQQQYYKVHRLMLAYKANRDEVQSDLTAARSECDTLLGRVGTLEQQGKWIGQTELDRIQKGQLRDGLQEALGILANHSLSQWRDCPRCRETQARLEALAAPSATPPGGERGSDMPNAAELLKSHRTFNDPAVSEACRRAVEDFQ